MRIKNADCVTVLTMAAVLASFGSALVIEQVADLRSQIAVLAVVLALTLSRTTTKPGAREFLYRVVTLPVIAYAATQVGSLMLHHPVIGDTLFALALSLAVWLRRFGRSAGRLAGLITLPFIGILVVPIPLSASTATSIWSPVISLIALCWSTLAVTVARELSWLPKSDLPPSGAELADGQPSAAPWARASAFARAAISTRWWEPQRLSVSSRMALQLGVGLGLAFLIGHWLYPRHWPWLVLSCYLVSSGNRGRGDVLHKGILRLLGAAFGTVAATLLAGAFAAGDRIAVVLIFVVLLVAIRLRDRSYAYWAAGVTAMLALLNDYYGIGGPDQLPQRLGGVAIGAGIGVLVSWFLLPVRTGDVFRRRVANALAALSDYLTSLRTDPSGAAAAARTYGHRVLELEQLLPTLQFHRRTLGRRTDTHAAQVITALGDVRLALLEEQLDASTLGTLAKQVGAIRRRMVGGESSSPPTAIAGPGSAAAVSRLDAAFTVDLWRRHGGRAPSSAS
jgi:Fusaric acid resistance protein-like